jgi:DNA modification methylase
MKIKEQLFEYIDPKIKYSIINKEALGVIKDFPKNSFDLIITSPPYNIGKSYETKTTIEKYLSTQEEISMFLQIIILLSRLSLSLLKNKKNF